MCRQQKRGITFISTAVVVMLALTTTAESAVIDISSGTVTFDQVIGNSFIVSDKQFDINSFSAMGFDPADIIIQEVDNGLAGIGFDLVGPFSVQGGDDDLLSLSSDGDGGSAGFTLNFDVTIIVPGFLISDLHLEIDGFSAHDDIDFSSGDDESRISVTETITGAGITPPIVLVASASESGDTLMDWRDLDTPVTSVSVEKVVEFFANEDHDLFSSSGDGDVEAGTIRQTFSQIPEPSTLAFLALAAGSQLRRKPRRG